MKLSVIVPVFNEVATVAEILRRVVAVEIPKEIIVVDDGSDDGTRELLQALEAGLGDARVLSGVLSQPDNRLHVLYHEKNQGKGAALRTALRRVTGDVVLIQDADLEYDPAEYSTLIQPILDGKADVVYGSRFAGTPRRVLYFRHALGNWLLTFFSNLFTNLNLTDMETGYKVFKREVITSIPIRSNRFGFEPEITAKIARLGCRVYEVAISYSGRTYEEGKKITWRDGLIALWSVVRFGLSDDPQSANPGYITLRRMRRLRRYNAWIWQTIAPFVGNRVLEAGAGLGNITPFLLKRKWLVPVDADLAYMNRLERLYGHLPNVRPVQLDLSSQLVQKLAADGLDTVLCMNVLEHIDDDSRTLRNFHELLSQGGRLILVVPAHPVLHGSMDSHLGHHRRYGKAEVVGLLEEAGFHVEHAAYFNALGAIGWYLNGKIFRRKAVPGLQAYLFDWLVPILIFERRLRLEFGLSVIAIGQKLEQTVTAPSLAKPGTFSGEHRAAVPVSK